MHINVFNFLFIVLCFVGVPYGDPAELAQCCEAGTQQAINSTDSQDSCNLQNPSFLRTISRELHGPCLTIIWICCVDAHRRNECETGKRLAHAGVGCTDSFGIGSQYRKDCCEACRLGLVLGHAGNGCGFPSLHFNYPWNAALQECCHQIIGQSTPPTAPNTVPDTSRPFSLAPENVVQPTVDRTRSPGDRCQQSNPCQQLCLDTGIAIECSCHGGFHLGPDLRSCLDVDECVYDLHECTPHHQQCVNTNGSYYCVNRDGSIYQPPPEQDPYRGETGDDFNELSNNYYPSLHTQQNRCPPGYVFVEETQVCDDLDECQKQVDACDRLTELCRNTIGSYACVARQMTQCPPGYKFNTLTDTCTDVDECNEGLDACNPVREICLNLQGSYECQLRTLSTCPAGYKYNTAVSECQDVDECAERLHNCAEGETCRNIIGAYECDVQCGAGFRFRRDQRQCIDIDECAEGLHNCDLRTSTCQNTDGGFHCAEKPPLQCAHGFRYDNRTVRCTDIDECAEDPRACDPFNQICHNIEGSYQCQIRGTTPPTSQHSYTSISSQHPYNCPVGFQYDRNARTCSDVNECQLGSHTCLSSQRCDNTIGSFTCIRLTGCGTGYTLNAHTSQCEDDDECILGTHNCGTHYSCKNILGSFRCVPKQCPVGFRLDIQGQCTPFQCPPGLQPDREGSCSDINECETSNPCGSSQNCVNTPGSYYCQTQLVCGGGYEPNPQGNQCVDIDECLIGSHECKQGQLCRNKPGGYVCQCHPGFQLNQNRDCEDLDECNSYTGQVCAINAECVNTIGSYSCNCKNGFKQTEDGKTCSDINECEDYPNLCQHTCINTWGSYQCTCNNGFTVASDNRSCHDIDECTMWRGRGSLCIGVCTNEVGSYRCTCPTGYRLGADKRTCEDIDECVEESVCQGQDDSCLNTRGSYKCNRINCPHEYTRDPQHKNRCKRKTLVCLQNDQECLNQPLSISFNFLTFVSDFPIPPSGHVNLFTMRGPLWSTTSVQFEFKLKDVRAPRGIQPGTEGHFQLRRTAFNQAVVSLTRTIQGPQDLELELLMKLYHNSAFSGTAVARLFIFVSQYDY